MGRGDGHHCTVGLYGSCWSKASRMLVRKERGPSAPCWHACLSALPPTVCQLCPFPDPLLGKFFIQVLITSCLDHVLSSGNPDQSSGLVFSHLALGSSPLALHPAFSGPGPFFDFSAPDRLSPLTPPLPASLWVRGTSGFPLSRS